MSLAAPVSLRRASDADIPLLAEAELMVSVMPDGHSMWDAADVGAGHRLAAVVEAIFALRAWHWANVEDFTVVTVGDEPAAVCGVFDARHGEGRIPIDLDRMPDLRRQLGWSAAESEAFARSYRALWGDDLAWLVPQAEAIVETVAVLPAFRGLGLGDQLMKAAKADARARGFATLGVMAIAGNIPAERLYRRHFDHAVTYGADHFGGAFPGIVKFRTVLG